MSEINSTIIGAAEREFEAATATGSSELDKMAFLKLLVAQLQHQDPLNPMDDTAFVSQLAQFTQLETLNNISDNMDNVIEGMGRQENLAASGFLGKYVESYGDQVSVDASGNRTELYYYLNEDVSSGSVNIMDANGNIIRSFNLGAKTAGGPYALGWDGYDQSGKKAPEGVYKVGMSTLNAQGEAVLVASQVSGKVDRVFYEDGVQYLGLEDGRVISMSYVTAIREPLESDYAETDEQKLVRLNKEITDIDKSISDLNTQITALEAEIADAATTQENREKAEAALELAKAKKTVFEDTRKDLVTQRDTLEDALDA